VSRRKVRTRWAVASAAAAFGVGLATENGPLRRLDERLYRTLNRARGSRSDVAFKGLTELGSIWASAGTAVVLALGGRRREGLDAFGAAGTMWIVGQITKGWFGRPRPYAALEDVRLLIDRPRGTSWPSSHPAVLLAFVTVAGRDLDVPRQAMTTLRCVVGAVGLSRVCLGVHYPADVAGGLLLGRCVADLWSAWVSPHIVGALRAGAAGRVAR
jgi:undecaprenyl-diphosphatase